ncbi:unnamed protein product [Pleuronectes platessa]|uniref:Uncharacterized protein n=1 Tax=Pleuronectes platessa TaxID=8262 RepID=A0A9N7TKN0_PLEPL|nr:unnamed protein product [Pleuronectes platessa]
MKYLFFCGCDIIGRHCLPAPVGSNKRRVAPSQKSGAGFSPVPSVVVGLNPKVSVSPTNHEEAENYSFAITLAHGLAELGIEPPTPSAVMAAQALLSKLNHAPPHLCHTGS